MSLQFKIYWHNQIHSFILIALFQVAWIHIDRQMILTIHRHVISRIPRYSITYDNANTWLLHVNQAQQDDRGYYMCQVNTNPMISQVGYLQVVGMCVDIICNEQFSKSHALLNTWTTYVCGYIKIAHQTCASKFKHLCSIAPAHNFRVRFIGIETARLLYLIQPHQI